MEKIFAQEQIRKSIFLAGPTPRSAEVQSWRPEALALLEEMKFDGDVYVPERPDFKSFSNYDAQVNWEWEALNAATVVVFWVPRELKTMPAMITNVEFGMYAASGKAVLGYPEGAEKMSYLDMLATRFNVPVFRDLSTTLYRAVQKTEKPFKRIF